MELLVSLILFACGPRKVDESVVRRVAVWEMTTLVFLGFRANKGFEHDTMNCPLKTLAVAPKGYLKIPLANRKCFQSVPFITNSPMKSVWPAQSNALPLTPHTAIVASTVAGESWNWAVLNRRLIVGHDSCLYTGCVQGPGRLTIFSAPLLYEVENE